MLILLFLEHKRGIWKVCSTLIFLSNGITNPFMLGIILNTHLPTLLWYKFYENIVKQTQNIMNTCTVCILEKRKVHVSKLFICWKVCKALIFFVQTCSGLNFLSKTVCGLWNEIKWHFVNNNKEQITLLSSHGVDLWGSFKKFPDHFNNFHFSCWIQIEIICRERWILAQ